jgi:hypothetical protein
VTAPSRCGLSNVYARRASGVIGHILDLDAGQMEKLVLACRTHTDGTTSSDPTVGACFDADRLDLGRVGIEPDPDLMSTEAGRKRAQQFAVRSACDYEAGEPSDVALAPQ